MASLSTSLSASPSSLGIRCPSRDMGTYAASPHGKGDHARSGVPARHPDGLDLRFILAVQYQVAAQYLAALSFSTIFSIVTMGGYLVDGLNDRSPKLEELVHAAVSPVDM